jgi:hypothetical protein
LHRDCSLNNSMIEDTKDGSQGFMSVSTLRAMGKLNYQYSQVMKLIKELKLAMDHLTPKKMPKIKHTYNDDLESMFYVFAWICIMFKGPMGEEHCLGMSWTVILKKWRCGYQSSGMVHLEKSLKKPK